MNKSITAMPKYAEYKESGVDWLGEIPAGWEVKRVKNIFRLIIDPAENSNNYELLSIYTDIGVKPRKDLEERGNKASTTDGYWIVKKGDFIVNKLLAWMGAVGVSEYEGVTSPAYDILRAYIPISEYFYHVLFRSNVFSTVMKRHSKGIMDMRLRLYFDKFGVIEVPYPDLPEQTAIAKFLDDKVARIEVLVGIKRRQIELLAERKQILIQNAVTQGLNPDAPMKESGVDWIGEIPAHWEVKRLKYVAINRNDKRETTNSSLQYFGMENVESWTGRLVGKNVQAEGLSNYFLQGDVMFGKLRPYLAKAFLATREGLCSTEFMVFSCAVNLSNDYLEKLMLSSRFIQKIDASTYGSKMPRANPEFIKNCLISCPPFGEQKEISQCIDFYSAKIDTAITLKQNQIEKLTEYKTTLINAAVTGKIKVAGE